MFLDCAVDPICKRTQFHEDGFYHKLIGPGLKYGVPVCINNGYSVWTYLPYLNGSNPDLKIFQGCLKTYLLSDKNVVTDDAFQNVKVCKPLKTEPESKYSKRSRTS